MKKEFLKLLFSQLFKAERALEDHRELDRGNGNETKAEFMAWKTSKPP